ncbi:Hypothetical predicted protein [Marmota monax]|uniref:Uncharacterized protein n=1 Tax=Marmota monax TaxID=9995 RepID=A0A5E4D6V5_MARMO|nr:hypothetical protein GHT09_008882 [Marmota monax]VTJ89450.1 Hypothetical predicted protein [Marmota monax]
MLTWRTLCPLQHVESPREVPAAPELSPLRTIGGGNRERHSGFQSVTGWLQTRPNVPQEGLPMMSTGCGGEGAVGRGWDTSY